ncbi:RidA family protein [Chitinophaga sp. MM2321]|uniref:RidA family protein n=1 Tax=Chitinophaga sp. MM2321 TaxID=3137178 RepID=UPI0032D56D20
MTDKIIIKGPGVPASPLPFSAAIKSGDFLFISGQASTDLKGSIIAGTFEEECRRSFENLRAVLTAAGLDFTDVVQVRNYVAQQADLPAFNNIYREYFKEPYPARTTLIGCLGDVLKFEVDAVARIN